MRSTPRGAAVTPARASISMRRRPRPARRTSSSSTSSPPPRPALEAIVPRDYVFIVDVSGSMEGFPLDTTKKLMKELLSRLRETDTFDVELFSGASMMYAPASVTATKKHIDDAIAWIDTARAGGGTELLPAIQTAMSLPKAEGTSRSFVVVTDG